MGSPEEAERSIVLVVSLRPWILARIQKEARSQESFRHVLSTIPLCLHAPGGVFVNFSASALAGLADLSLLKQACAWQGLADHARRPGCCLVKPSHDTSLGLQNHQVGYSIKRGQML